MPNRVLVTGGSGVVGRAVVDRLLASGHAVRIFDRSVPPAECAGAEWRFGDVTDHEALVAALDGCDAVVHLAARMPQARLDEAGYHACNVEPTRVLAEACVTRGVARFAFASTIEIYGPQPISAPLDEDAERRFTGTYSRTKWACEELLRSLARDHGLEAVSLRMPMVFGPGFYHEKSVLALFALLRLGLPVPVPAPRAPVSFVSSRDAAQAFELALVRPGVAGESFNVAAPDTPSMEGFLWELAEAVGSRSRPVALPRWLLRGMGQLVARRARRGGGRGLIGTPAELMGFATVGGAYAIDKARRMLGYEPVDRCADAVATCYRWFFGLDASRRFELAWLRRN
jgi:nucleoside-diphosphate-sugar epimerase